VCDASANRNVSRYLLELELSLKITSGESVCTWCINDRLRRRAMKQIRARDVSPSSHGYRKSIRVNLRGLMRIEERIAFRAHIGKAEMPSENP